MKKLIILAAVAAAAFGCSKKTSEEPKPVVANGKNAQIHLVMEEDNDASPASVSSSSSSKGQFVTIGYNPFSTKPSVGYYSGTLIPVVTFPTYSAQIAAAGISEGCYNEYINIYSKAVAMQGGSDASACDFIDSLVSLSEECTELPAESKAAILQLKSLYTSFGICK